MIVSMGRLEGRFGSYDPGDAIDLPAGNAQIFRLAGQPDLLYKRFKRPRRGVAEIERIERLVEVGRGVDREAGSAAIRRIAWPRDLVVDGEAVVGVVLPHVGERYYRPEIGGTVLPRDLANLRRDREGVDTAVRLRLMRQLAGIMAALEYAELVHGDLTNQNLLWAPPPDESVVLVDCDGIHDASVEGSGGATPGWTDPRRSSGAIASHDMKSDWYALSLAIWRTLARTKFLPQRRNGVLHLPTTLPPEVRELLERTFADPMDPETRPSPREWADALDAALSSRRARRGIDRVAPTPVRTRGPVTIDRKVVFKSDANGAGEPRPTPTRSRKRKGRVLVAALLLAVIAVLAAGFVDSGPSLGQIRAEAAVARWTRSVLHTPYLTARCPSHSNLHVGARYRCGVETRGGAVARVQVTVGSERGIRRRIHIIAYRKRAVLGDIRARFRHRQSRGNYGLASISCPDTFSSRPGTAFRCRVRFTDGVKGEIAVRVRSRRGRYTWREVGVPLGGRASALH